MKISQPLVLLLGGLLSASSVGCSAVNAVVGEHRASSDDARASADRMVAVGRVFENQGRFDQAEAMYRKAMKKNPGDAAIRQQLQQLADRRNGILNEKNSIATAIARADRVSAPGQVARRGLPPRRATLIPVPEQSLPSAQMDLSVLELASSSSSPTVVQNKVTPAIASVAPEAFPVRRTSQVSSTQLMAVVDAPYHHTDLLLQGLTNGDSIETQCLAATLLGDCDPGNADIRNALLAVRNETTDSALILTVCDSLIQRGEADSTTAGCLIGLLGYAPVDIQIQAVSDLRHFAGTSSELACMTALGEQLSNSNSSLRAISAVTLGDFTTIDPTISDRLQQLAQQDQNETVREAASTAIARVNGQES
jgi:hypothetical protein